MTLDLTGCPKLGDKALRPNVRQHLEYFRGCIEEHGAEMVHGVLRSKDGKYKGGRLHFKLSRKDKYQLLQELGLLDKGATDAQE